MIRKLLLILTVVALMAAWLAFGLSGVAFAQNKLTVVVADDTQDEECADLLAEYEGFVVEDNVAEMAEVAEEIEFCLA